MYTKQNYNQTNMYILLLKPKHHIAHFNSPSTLISCFYILYRNNSIQKKNHYE